MVAERVLGLSDGMTAGVALIEGDCLEAVISEERLTRQKMAIGFPTMALAEVLRMQKIAASARWREPSFRSQQRRTQRACQDYAAPA